MSLEPIAWTGAILFAACGAPQAYLSWRQGHSRGISWGLLSLWLGGEICMLAYELSNQDWPQVFNYVGNMSFLVVIIYYKIRPR